LSERADWFGYAALDGFDAAMKVVLTAPSPTNNTPSLPFGCSISIDVL